MQLEDFIDNNSALIHIDDLTGKIVVAKETMQIAFFKELKDRDEAFFDNALVYVYHVYKFSHPFARMFFNERKKKVCNVYLNSIDSDFFSNDVLVRKIIKLFVDTEYTPSQRLYLSVLKDMEHLQAHISTIPMMKTEKIKRKIPYVLEADESGQQRTILLDVDTEIQIDNSKEKLAALAAVEKIMDLQTKLRLKVEKEELEGKRQQVRWMFDQREAR